MARRRFVDSSTALSASNFNGMLDRNLTNLVRNGDFESWGAGTSVAPDHWTATLNGGTVDRASGGGTFLYGLYSAHLQQTSGGSGDSRIVFDAYSRFGIGWRSQVVTAAVWVKCAAASTAKLRIDDGATTAEAIHTGGGAWERLVVSMTVGAAITAFSMILEVAKPGAGTIDAYFDGATLTFGDSEGLYSEAPSERLVEAIDFDNNGTHVKVRCPRQIHGTRTFSLTGGSGTEVQAVSFPRGFKAVYSAQATMRCAAGTHDDYSVKVSALTTTQITFLFRKDGGGNLSAADAPVVNYVVFGVGYADNADQW